MTVGIVAVCLVSLAACTVTPPPPPRTVSQWTIGSIPASNTLPSPLTPAATVVGPASMIGQSVRIDWICGVHALGGGDVVLADGGNGTATGSVPVAAPIATAGGYGLCTVRESVAASQPAVAEVHRYYDWSDPSRWGVAISHGPAVPTPPPVDLRQTSWNLEDTLQPEGWRPEYTFGLTWVEVPQTFAGHKARIVWQCAAHVKADAITFWAPPLPDLAAIGTAPLPDFGSWDLQEGDVCTVTETTEASVPPPGFPCYCVGNEGGVGSFTFEIIH